MARCAVVNATASLSATPIAVMKDLSQEFTTRNGLLLAFLRLLLPFS